MLETWVPSWVGKIPWRRKWQLTPLFLPGEFHGQRSLVGYSLLGCKESDMTKQLSFTHIIYILIYFNISFFSTLKFHKKFEMICNNDIIYYNESLRLNLRDCKHKEEWKFVAVFHLI